MYSLVCLLMQVRIMSRPPDGTVVTAIEDDAPLDGGGGDMIGVVASVSAGSRSSRASIGGRRHRHSDAAKPNLRAPESHGGAAAHARGGTGPSASEAGAGASTTPRLASMMAWAIPGMMHAAPMLAVGSSASSSSASSWPASAALAPAATSPSYDVAADAAAVALLRGHAALASSSSSLLLDEPALAVAAQGVTPAAQRAPTATTLPPASLSAPGGSDLQADADDAPAGAADGAAGVDAGVAAATGAAASVLNILAAAQAAAPAIRALRPQGTRRKLSMSANEKLRRTVHKLVLINRFNKAHANTAAAAEGTAAVTTGGSLPSLATNTVQGAANLAPRGSWRRSRSRRLLRAMDDYVKEQSDLYQYAVQRKARDDEPLPWYLLRPDSHLRIVWDVIILILVVYSAFTVPLRIGFETSPCGSQLERRAPHSAPHDNLVAPPPTRSDRRGGLRALFRCDFHC